MKKLIFTLAFFLITSYSAFSQNNDYYYEDDNYSSNNYSQNNSNYSFDNNPTYIIVDNNYAARIRRFYTPVVVESYFPR